MENQLRKQNSFRGNDKTRMPKKPWVATLKGERSEVTEEPFTEDH